VSFSQKKKGIPVSDAHLEIKALKGVPKKLRKRLQPWKGRKMTSGGRLILTKTSLSSLPIYTMGIYLLQECVHQQMDSVRANFFWQGANDKLKYHMVKWRNLCLPHEALIGKWGWRMLQADKGCQCSSLLQGRHPFLHCGRETGSQFWKGVLKSRNILKWGCHTKVNNDRSTRFWE